MGPAALLVSNVGDLIIRAADLLLRDGCTSYYFYFYFQKMRQIHIFIKLFIFNLIHLYLDVLL
jgi:hypothetical protein